jgi:sugar O-acyltransferase (sialic acid O-acetyltransferase NeuD family)
VVLEALRCSLSGTDGAAEIHVRDQEMNKAGQTFQGLTVSHPEIDEQMTDQYAHIAIGVNSTRQRLLEEMEKLAIRPCTILHPGSSIASRSKIESASFVASQAVVGPDTLIGHSVIINHGAIVDHDCEIGSFTHIAPGATLGGGVQIGKNCLIGSGAVVLPGVRIADNCTVGAGSVVLEDIPANETRIGNPAMRKK